jgi:integrase
LLRHELKQLDKRQRDKKPENLTWVSKSWSENWTAKYRTPEDEIVALQPILLSFEFPHFTQSKTLSNYQYEPVKRMFLGKARESVPFGRYEWYAAQAEAVEFWPKDELEPPARQGFVEYDDFRRLRQALPEYLRVPATLGYLTGMRLSEVTNLRWEHVNLKKRMIFLPAGYTNNDEPRMVPLIGDLPEMFKILREQNPGSEQVFTRKGVPLQSFRKAWNRACVAAGLGYIESVAGKKPKYRGRTFHDLRRSAVSNLVQSGVDPVTATLISGHKTMEVFKRYRIAVERHLVEAGSKVSDYLDSSIQKIEERQRKEQVISAPVEIKLISKSLQ